MWKPMGRGDERGLMDSEVNIPLAKVCKNESGTVWKAEYYKMIHHMYTQQYCEAIGVLPTESMRKWVSRSAPLEDCEIEAIWQDDSSICGHMKIMQPVIQKKRPPPVAQAAELQRELESKLPKQKAQDLHDLKKALEKGIRPEPFKVGDPEVPTAATVDRIIGKAGLKLVSDEDALAKAAEVAFREMQEYDEKRTKGCDEVMTEELEKLRRRTRRGIEEGDREEPLLLQWGEDGERELTTLKKKFILPFAAERPNASGRGTTVTPWQDAKLLANCELAVPEEHLEEALEPVCITFEAIHQEQMKYIHDRLPLELLTTRKDPWLFAALRERLGSPEAVRLTGLLAHYLYWNILGHIHPPSRRLPMQTSQSLVLTLQELWARLVEPIKKSVGRRGELLGRDSPAGICFVLPVFMLTLKRGVERILLEQYRRMFADTDAGAELTQTLVNNINIMFMNIFDLDCAYSNFGALDSSSEAQRLWKKLQTLQMKIGLTPANRMLGREFRTTPMVLLLMNSDGHAPINAKTRAFMRRSDSDSVLASVAGFSPKDRIEQERRRQLVAKGLAKAPDEPFNPRPKLDAGRRAVLYRTAKSRFAAGGEEILRVSNGTGL
eukprot:TRINITY_DN10013_c0_g1_i1.p1 TRINITY_DN10013_c0_g1~~TRINITY_DN10013_c0_g1_i1.p1  ORF type:complete len:607 (-),score=177.47 TRINITY_DN10013_c0_g1_i1:72-1892(-)